MTRPAFVSFVLALCPPAFAQTGPTVYPKLDHATTRHALIVATVSDVTLMPNDICVYGAGDDLGFIVTSSHYGTQGYQDPTAQLLLLIHHDGKHSLLVRYARANLITNKAGKHYLPMLRPLAAHFLPCSVNALLKRSCPTSLAPCCCSRPARRTPVRGRRTRNGWCRSRAATAHATPLPWTACKPIWRTSARG